MHTDNPLSHQITSPVTSFFFWLTHIGQLPPDLAGVSTSVLHKVLENILLHSVLAVRTPSFRSCLAPLWCACKKKKQLTMKLSPLHYVKQSPQGCLEMRSSSWSPSCCLNGEGPRTIAAFYLTRPIRQPCVFRNLLVHLVINKAVEIQKMSNGKRERKLQSQSDSVARIIIYFIVQEEANIDDTQTLTGTLLWACSASWLFNSSDDSSKTGCNSSSC